MKGSCQTSLGLSDEIYKITMYTNRVESFYIFGIGFKGYRNNF